MATGPALRRNGVDGPDATAVPTTAATNSTPYGYSQAQADAIVAQLNIVIKALQDAGLLS